MRSRFYTIDGVTKTLGEWCREFNLPYLRTYMRIKRGMTFTEAITKPEGSLAKPRKFADRERQVTIDGRTQTLRSWATEHGVPYNKVLKRVIRGWDPEEALKVDGRVFDRAGLQKRAEKAMLGKRFGKLVVLSCAGVQDHNRQWRCKCDCGNETMTSTNKLKSGHTRSCGCLWEERKGLGNRIHGKSDDPIYIAWLNMFARCEDPNHIGFTNYGGRGISVCERWKSFENFYADMGDPPTGYTIERRNNNGNYEPGNCEWATRLAQGRNKRSNRMITIDGRTQCLAAWLGEFGVNPSTFYYRVNKGWSEIEAITGSK